MMRTGEHLVATGSGVFRVSTVMRRTAGKRWLAELEKDEGGRYSSAQERDEAPAETRLSQEELLESRGAVTQKAQSSKTRRLSEALHEHAPEEAAETAKKEENLRIRTAH